MRHATNSAESDTAVWAFLKIAPEETLLVAVNVGTKRSEFTYDGESHRTRILEKENGVIQTDTRVLWCNATICEERAADGTTVTRRAFTEGEQVATGAAFFLDSESQLRAAVHSYQAPPDQPAAAAPAQRIDITFRSQPDPPRTGENTFEVAVRDASGQPISDAEVSVTFFMAAMPTMNMPAMRNETKLPHVGSGVYRGPGQVLMAGRWDTTVSVSKGGQRLSSKRVSLVAK